MKKFIWTVCLAVLLVSMSACYAGPAGILVKDGQVSGCIVIPDGTEKGRVLTAAEDLVSYIRQMSGASVPLLRETEDCTGFRVFIGSTRLAPVDPAGITEGKVGFDGFIIRSIPDGVVIAGNNVRGTANGVYHFAEEVLDVHWFSPEDDGPACPKRQTIEIPSIELAVKPDLAWRSQWQAWMDANFKTDPRAKKFYENRDRWWEFNRLWSSGEYGSGHVFFQIVPDELFDTHPEYFPLLDYTFKEGDGSYLPVKADKDGAMPRWPWRTGRYKGGDTVQRCLSNPDVLKMAVEWTAQHFDKSPNLRFDSLSADDGPWWCECDACKAMGSTISHRNLAFVNAVAKANEAKYPDRGYIFYAYMKTLEPPAGMKAHRNVVPMIAPLWQCRIHPISSNCPDSVYLRRVISGWQKIAGRIAYYSYTNAGDGIFTFPSVIAMAEEMRFLRDCGSIGGFRTWLGPPSVNWAMQSWMEIKLMWDVDQDPVKLRRQFIEGYYGQAAAEAVEKVYDTIETGLRTTVHDRKWLPDDGAGLHSLSSEEILKPFIAKCGDDIDAALSAVQSEQEVFRDRVTRDMETLLGKRH